MIRQYKIDFLTIVQDQAIKSDCGDITFINRGPSTATINSSLEILFNQSITLSANANEIDKTIYTVKFSSLPGRLIVLRKIYTT
jgi:hypothetical protein